jgi:RimJ/RimL family protein N-acetyltransferase
MKTYETERLILKPTDLEDLDFLLKILNTPKYYKYIGDRKVRTIEDAENYFNQRIFPQYEKLGFGNYTVMLKSDETKIGFCGVYVRPNLETPDIGFAFFEEYEGKGYAYESASKLKELAKEEFGLKKLGGITVEYNHSSRKLLEKLGLKFQKKFFMEGDPEELMYFETEL